MVQPGGPSSHCLTSSGLVRASKTRRRGASKTRVITISRPVGVVTFNCPAFIIGALLLAFRAYTFPLFGLKLSEQGIEALEPAFPELAIAIQPFADAGQRLGLEAAGALLGVLAA